jgi:hypothetical protein
VNQRPAGRTRIGGLVLLGFFVAACTIALETQTEAAPDRCNERVVEGIVAQHPAVGIGLRDSKGVVHRTVWPYQWSSRFEAGRFIVVDGRGTTVVGEGDELRMAGWVEDDVYYPCSRGTRLS